MIQYLSVYVHHPGGGRLEAGGGRQDARSWRRDAGGLRQKASRFQPPASCLFQDLVCNQTHYVRESGHI